MFEQIVSFEPFTMKKNRGSLNEDKVIAIYKSDKTVATIAREFGVNPEEVSRIKNRKAYAYFTEHLDPPKQFTLKPGTFRFKT